MAHGGCRKQLGDACLQFRSMRYHLGAVEVALFCHRASRGKCPLPVQASAREAGAGASPAERIVQLRRRCYALVLDMLRGCEREHHYERRIA